MDASAAARRWADTWRHAWPHRDIEAITALYDDDCLYRALAFREPDHGREGARLYLTENFAAEEAIECWFGDPVADGSRAAVEWWASWIEDGEQLTLAGTTMLRFAPDGQVVDQRDYWNQVERREPPYAGW